jgi:hypothetical protein
MNDQSVAHHGYLYRQSTRLVSSAKPDEGGEEAEAQQQLPEEDDELVPGENRSKMTRIEVEHHIVYSRTYHVPMLCLRAWDDCASPFVLLSFALSDDVFRRWCAVASLNAALHWYLARRSPSLRRKQGQCAPHGLKLPVPAVAAD